MLLILTRDIFTADATLGRLDVDYGRGGGAQPFGFTCEDEDRGLRQGMPPEDIVRLKVAAETAIPTGRYQVRFTYSPKYAETMKSYGRMDGKMPEVLHVTGFRGIRIHSGNNESHTAGCLLPGLTRSPARMTVGKSRAACAWLYEYITRCEEVGDAVSILIRDGRTL